MPNKVYTFTFSPPARMAWLTAKIYRKENDSLFYLIVCDIFLLKLLDKKNLFMMPLSVVK